MRILSRSWGRIRLLRRREGAGRCVSLSPVPPKYNCCCDAGQMDRIRRAIHRKFCRCRSCGRKDSLRWSFQELANFRIGKTSGESPCGYDPSGRRRSNNCASIARGSKKRTAQRFPSGESNGCGPSIPKGSALRATSSDSNRPCNSSDAAGSADIGVESLRFKSGTKVFYPKKG